VSEISVEPRRRRRRSDADRSAAAVLASAVRVLGQRPDATVEDIAADAGVVRQTVYAHFPSRQALLSAVVERITQESLAAMDAADIDAGPAGEALLRWLDASWRMLDRYPLLLHPSIATTGTAQAHEQHAPIIDRLLRLITRGQEAGDFDRHLAPGWLVTATMALGHAAGDEVAAGRISRAQAGAMLRTSVQRLYRVA
jgi:AcrR family transcriptional regulator